MTNRPDAPGPADDWPSWTDQDTWELGPEPTEADAAWAAANLNVEGWHDQDLDVPDEVDDASAEESALEDGSLP
jgi:hypothetical protein